MGFNFGLTERSKAAECAIFTAYSEKIQFGQLHEELLLQDFPSSMMDWNHTIWTKTTSISFFYWLICHSKKNNKV